MDQTVSPDTTGAKANRKNEDRSRTRHDNIILEDVSGNRRRRRHRRSRSSHRSTIKRTRDELVPSDSRQTGRRSTSHRISRRNDGSSGSEGKHLNLTEQKIQNSGSSEDRRRRRDKEGTKQRERSTDTQTKTDIVEKEEGKNWWEVQPQPRRGRGRSARVWESSLHKSTTTMSGNETNTNVEPRIEATLSTNTSLRYPISSSLPNTHGTVPGVFPMGPPLSSERPMMIRPTSGSIIDHSVNDIDMGLGSGDFNNPSFHNDNSIGASRPIWGCPPGPFGLQFRGPNRGKWGGNGLSFPGWRFGGNPRYPGARDAPPPPPPDDSDTLLSGTSSSRAAHSSIQMRPRLLDTDIEDKRQSNGRIGVDNVGGNVSEINSYSSEWEIQQRQQYNRTNDTTRLIGFPNGPPRPTAHPNLMPWPGVGIPGRFPVDGNLTSSSLQNNDLLGIQQQQQRLPPLLQRRLDVASRPNWLPTPPRTRQGPLRMFQGSERPPRWLPNAMTPNRPDNMQRGYLVDESDNCLVQQSWGLGGPITTNGLTVKDKLEEDNVVGLQTFLDLEMSRDIRVHSYYSHAFNLLEMTYLSKDGYHILLETLPPEVHSLQSPKETSTCTPPSLHNKMKDNSCHKDLISSPMGLIPRTASSVLNIMRLIKSLPSSTRLKKSRGANETTVPFIKPSFRLPSDVIESTHLARGIKDLPIHLFRQFLHDKTDLSNSTLPMVSIQDIMTEDHSIRDLARTRQFIASCRVHLSRNNSYLHPICALPTSLGRTINDAYLTDLPSCPTFPLLGQSFITHDSKSEKSLYLTDLAFQFKQGIDHIPEYLSSIFVCCLDRDQGHLDLMRFTQQQNDMMSSGRTTTSRCITNITIEKELLSIIYN